MVYNEAKVDNLHETFFFTCFNPSGNIIKIKISENKKPKHKKINHRYC